MARPWLCVVLDEHDKVLLIGGRRWSFGQWRLPGGTSGSYRDLERECRERLERTTGVRAEVEAAVPVFSHSMGRAWTCVRMFAKDPPRKGDHPPLRWAPSVAACRELEGVERAPERDLQIDALQLALACPGAPSLVDIVVDRPTLDRSEQGDPLADPWAERFAAITRTRPLDRRHAPDQAMVMAGGATDHGRGGAFHEAPSRKVAPGQSLEPVGPTHRSAYLFPGGRTPSCSLSLALELASESRRLSPAPGVVLLRAHGMTPVSKIEWARGRGAGRRRRRPQRGWVVLFDATRGLDLLRLLRRRPIPPGPALEIAARLAAVLDGLERSPDDERALPPAVAPSLVRASHVVVNCMGQVSMLAIGGAFHQLLATAEAQTTTAGAVTRLLQVGWAPIPDHARGIHALGCLLYGMLSGVYPVPPSPTAGGGELLRQALCHLECRMGDAPDGLKRLLADMLAPRPSSSPTAGEVVERARQLTREVGETSLGTWAARNIPASPARL